MLSFMVVKKIFPLFIVNLNISLNGKKHRKVTDVYVKYITFELILLLSKEQRQNSHNVVSKC